MPSVWCLAELEPPIQPTAGKITSLLSSDGCQISKCSLKYFKNIIVCQLKGGYSLSLEWIFWTQFPPVNAALSQLQSAGCNLLLDCCEIGTLPSWCEPGTWNMGQWAELRWAQNREQVTPQPSHHLQTAATVHWPCTDRDRGSTEPLFRSRIWMILFRPFAEFAFFWESCIILALRKHIFD